MDRCEPALLCLMLLYNAYICIHRTGPLVGVYPVVIVCHGYHAAVDRDKMRSTSRLSDAAEYRMSGGLHVSRSHMRYK